VSKLELESVEITGFLHASSLNSKIRKQISNNVLTLWAVADIINKSPQANETRKQRGRRSGD